MKPSNFENSIAEKKTFMNGTGKIQTGEIDFDIAAREAQVIGKCPRIEPLAFEEISDEAKRMLKEVATSFGSEIRDAREASTVDEEQRTLGKTLPGSAHIPPTIATMMRHPRLYHGQTTLSIELLSGGTISPRERELVVLRVAWLCRAPYEWGEHVEIAKLCGLSRTDVERVTEGSSAAGWTNHESALLRAVEELLGDQSISDETWNVLAETWNEQQLIELPVLVGVYLTFAMQQNSLKVQLPAHSKGLLHR